MERISAQDLAGLRSEDPTSIVTTTSPPEDLYFRVHCYTEQQLGKELPAETDLFRLYDDGTKLTIKWHAKGIKAPSMSDLDKITQETIDECRNAALRQSVASPAMRLFVLDILREHNLI